MWSVRPPQINDRDYGQNPPPDAGQTNRKPAGHMTSSFTVDVKLIKFIRQINFPRLQQRPSVTAVIGQRLPEEHEI